MQTRSATKAVRQRRNREVVVEKDVNLKYTPGARPPGFFDPLLFAPSKSNAWYHFPLAYTIDFCKGITPFVIVLLMIAFREAPYNALENPSAWAYLGTHGSYGLLWICKNIYGFGDESFSQNGSILGQLSTLIMLVHYWLPIWLICSCRTDPPPLWSVALGIFLYGCGVFFHFSADIQKAQYIELKTLLRKELGNDESQRLIGNVLQSRLFSVCRNPNYFGEFLIYMSFCVLSFRWLPFVTFGAFMLIVWSSFILKKEKSMQRHGEEFANYQAATAIVVPGIL